MHYIRQALGATSIYLLANGLPDFEKTMGHFSMARSQFLKSRNIDNANKKALHGVGDITSPFSKYVVNKNLPTYRCTNNDKRPIIGHLASNLWQHQ